MTRALMEILTLENGIMERFLTEPPSQTMAKFLTDTLKLSTRLAPRLTRISTTPTRAFCSHTLQSTSLLMQGEAHTSVPTSQRRGAKNTWVITDYFRWRRA